MHLQDCFCSSARRAARTLTARYEAALAPHGLSLPQFELLAVLHGTARSGRAIAAGIGLDAATVSRNLRPLLQRQMVRSEADGTDGRQLLYSLTNQGTLAFRKALPAWREVQQQTADCLPQGALAMLHAIAQLDNQMP